MQDFTGMILAVCKTVTFIIWEKRVICNVLFTKKSGKMEGKRGKYGGLGKKA